MNVVCFVLFFSSCAAVLGLTKGTVNVYWECLLLLKSEFETLSAIYNGIQEDKTIVVQ